MNMWLLTVWCLITVRHYLLCCCCCCIDDVMMLLLLLLCFGDRGWAVTACHPEITSLPGEVNAYSMGFCLVSWFPPFLLIFSFMSLIITFMMAGGRELYFVLSMFFIHFIYSFIYYLLVELYSGLAFSRRLVLAEVRLFQLFYFVYET
jgi:hypothetical protein